MVSGAVPVRMVLSATDKDAVPVGAKLILAIRVRIIIANAISFQLLLLL